MLYLVRFSWAAFGGRFLVPSSPVLTSLRRLDGVCPVARKLATAQTFLDRALAAAEAPPDTPFDAAPATRTIGAI